MHTQSRPVVVDLSKPKGLEIATRLLHRKYGVPVCKYTEKTMQVWRSVDGKLLIKFKGEMCIAKNGSLTHRRY